MAQSVRSSSPRKMEEKLEESEELMGWSKFNVELEDFEEGGNEQMEHSDSPVTNQSVCFQPTPMEEVVEENEEELEQELMEQQAALPVAVEQTPASRRGHPRKRAASRELFPSSKQISSRMCSHSHSPSRAESDNSVEEAPALMLSKPKPAPCSIQVLAVMVKPKLLEFLERYENRIALKLSSSLRTEVDGMSS